MTILQALILGLVQGVTEFLPVSSSGHLVMGQLLLGFTEPAIEFDVLVHIATLGAIFIFFFKDLLKITKNEIIAVVIGTIPAVLVGLTIKDSLELLFGATTLVGGALMVTGVINLLSDRNLEKLPKTDKQITWRDGLVIGLFQAVAIFPGISRSGSTVFGGTQRQMSRTQAFRFSFLLGMPAIAGAGVLQFKDILETGFGSIDPLPFLVGAGAAFVSGLISLSIFKYVMTRARLEWFGYYCLVVGAGLIVLS